MNKLLSLLHLKYKHMGLSIKSIWNYKCPKCRKGDLFIKPFLFSKPLDMPKYCAVCGQDFEPEPGYYYGAMFLSYIVFTTIMLPLALLMVFYFKWSVNASMGIVIAISIICFFKILRGARALWIHIMIKYDPKVIKH